MQFANNENYENNNEFEDEEFEEESILMSMAEVEKETIEWLWYPYIPYGKITKIQGNPGDGKTNSLSCTVIVPLPTVMVIGDGAVSEKNISELTGTESSVNLFVFISSRTDSLTIFCQ